MPDHDTTTVDPAEAKRRASWARRTALIERARSAVDAGELDAIDTTGLGPRATADVRTAIEARRVALADPTTLIRERFAATHLDADRIALIRHRPDVLRDAAIRWWAQRLASRRHDIDMQSSDGIVETPDPSRFIDAATAQVAEWLADGK